MNDVLIPVGLIIFMGFFVYVVIHTSRKQRKAKAGVFRDFAEKNGLRYQEEDDGRAQRFAKDFDGIGQFKSSSLGKIIPKDVVDGTMNGSEVILFRHMIRFSEGWAREWFVAGLTCTDPLAERCSVQFCKGRLDKRSMYLQDPIVKERKIGAFNLVVRAASRSYASKIVDDGFLKQIAGLAGNLSFRPEIQIRGKRIAAYPADRNVSVEDVETLGKLFEFTKSATSV
jgi:hypothetical protein